MTSYRTYEPHVTLPQFVIYYGGASPGDGNFADIVAIDGEIVEVLAERERRKKKQSD